MSSDRDIVDLAAAVRSGSRSHLAQAITLVESRRVDDRRRGRDLLAALGGGGERTFRVGVSGIPGVGKSSFIEALGRHLIDKGHRVGVLAIDPSSARTRGSVLGDKTRMPSLAVDARAFVRPSPSAGTLGGVARTTASTMTLVDTFVLLALARSGDQLQGIKKGVLEVADVIAVNKADGEHVVEARSAAKDLRHALHVVGHREGAWRPIVGTCSALTGVGIAEVWNSIEAHRAFLGPLGIRQRRAAQQWSFAEALVRDELEERFRRSSSVRDAQGSVRTAVLEGRLTASAAADLLLSLFDGHQVTVP